MHGAFRSTVRYRNGDDWRLKMARILVGANGKIGFVSDIKIEISSESRNAFDFPLDDIDDVVAIVDAHEVLDVLGIVVSESDFEKSDGMDGQDD